MGDIKTKLKIFLLVSIMILFITTVVNFYTFLITGEFPLIIYPIMFGITTIAMILFVIIEKI